MVQKGYVGILGNTHILVYYFIIYFQRIKAYRVETMYIVRFHCNNGVSGKFNLCK